jgi:hypothetical protein
MMVRCDGWGLPRVIGEEILDGGGGAKETPTIHITLPRGSWPLSPIRRHHCHSSGVIITIGATPRSYKLPHAKLDAADLAHMVLLKADSLSRKGFTFHTVQSKVAYCQVGFFCTYYIFFANQVGSSMRQCDH